MDYSKSPPVQKAAGGNERCKIKECKILNKGCIEQSKQKFVTAKGLIFFANQDQSKGYNE
jgi:hypothetical protein